ncbi:MAG: ABC transporter ATP-binding protein [Sphaerochaeta sp.]|nr:ABC transporter ATP-binding protein [Sphaerochaeta sp.]
MNTLRKLQAYMEGRKVLLPAALIVSAISAIAAMVPYVLIWFIIRELFVNGTQVSESPITFYAWWAVGTAVASVLLYFIALSFSHLAAFRVETNMRRFAITKIINMPLGFFNSTTTGRMRKIIDDNASITHGFLAHQMPDLAAAILMPVTVLILIFVFDWRLGAACLIPVIFSFVTMSFMMNKRGRRFLQSYMTSLESMNTEAVEYVRGIPVVKVFQQTVFSFKNFHKSIVAYKDMVFGYTRMWEKPMSAYTVIINSFVFLLVPLTVLIISNTGETAQTILNLILYVLLTPVFSQSIMRSMYLNQALGQAGEAVDRIEHLTDYPALPVLTNPKVISGHSIRFENVSFCYPGTQNKAVDTVSFKIPEGKTTALVGASGSGKTTVARLIPRFWDVDEGSVYIGETNVKHLAPAELMSHISFVFQNTHLFKKSLWENLRFGNPSATLEEIDRALDQAQCREIIDRLPYGLYTKIGTEGTYLSGGEQQRIILARAILKNAPIVILDEATAFTDPENEHLIQQAFKKLTRGKTVLMIAHRLTSVTSADNILVMQAGKIAEQGSHTELMQKQGLYAKMFSDYQQSINWKIGKEFTNHA